MWRELIRECHADLEPIAGEDPDPEFFAGVPPGELASVERQLGVQLPGSLSSLLAETNGAYAVFGTRLIWPTGEIVRRNREMRTAPRYQSGYMPFEHLLFFADAGVDGIQFAFGIIQEAIEREDVCAWNPYDDSREWKAPSLKTYIEWWLDGKIKV